MTEYSLEELLPVVAKLAEKYTARESTSIPYEKAQQLMEAVLYCIRECEKENLPAGGNKLSAQAAYEQGYQMVLEKVNGVRETYNQIIPYFNAYGNENYHDTVTKGIAGFFKFYDAKFAPQETVITMDYPTLFSVCEMTGIDAIERYLSYILLEQKFMGKLPEEYVIHVLRQSHADYRRQFFNVCQVVSRDILGHMLVGKHLNLPLNERDYESMQAVVNMQGKAAMVSKVREMLEKLLFEKYGNDCALREYLAGDIEDYCTELGLGRVRV